MVGGEVVDGADAAAPAWVEAAAPGAVLAVVEAWAAAPTAVVEVDFGGSVVTVVGGEVVTPEGE